MQANGHRWFIAISTEDGITLYFRQNTPPGFQSIDLESLRNKEITTFAEIISIVRSNIVRSLPKGSRIYKLTFIRANYLIKATIFA